MPRICYVEKTFGSEHASIIEQAVSIMREYSEEGYSLTLRQLYYQFVARDLIPNTQQSYKRLGGIINDARLAGEIDWDLIEDRTRNLQKNSHWDSPVDIVAACARQFQIDKWAEQEHRVEVWIEKDALIGVIEDVCVRLDVPYFSCRGYTSQSEVWSAGHYRLKAHIAARQAPVIVHLGDHDPSGIDMTRDIAKRLTMFAGGEVTVRRIALNMDQVEHYEPPPNPAKITDSRACGYIAEYGADSWELDALKPQVISELVEDAVCEYRDDDLWEQAVEEESVHREDLQLVASNWESAVRALRVDGSE